MAQFSTVHAVFLTFLRALRKQGYQKLHTHMLPDTVLDAMQAVSNVSGDTLPMYCRDAILRTCKIIDSQATDIVLSWRRRHLTGEIDLNIEMEAHAMALAFEHWLEGGTEYIKDGQRISYDERTFKLLHATVH